MRTSSHCVNKNYDHNGTIFTTFISLLFTQINSSHNTADTVNRNFFNRLNLKIISALEIDCTMRLMQLFTRIENYC